MKFHIALALAINGASAFPSFMVERLAPRSQPGCTTSATCNKRLHIPNSKIGYNPNSLTEAQKLSAARSNCGEQGPCLVFNAADQAVSTSGEHAYQDPGPTDIRGPCPGLNAAANHGYLPRNGVASISETTEGLQTLYGMSPELGAVLAAYAVAFDGDVTTQTWSIGGPAQGFLPPNPLIGSPQGISYSHNKYEGDSSIGRCDAYLNGGDAHSLSPVRFSYAYATGMSDDRYTIDKFARGFTKNSFRSEMTNALYFAPLFSTTLVSPAAYNFVINFMSNHTAEEPSGYLDGSIFKEFFAITGDYPNFTWLPGKERIPNNWYKRTSTNEYGAVQGVFGDLLPTFAAYPDSFRFGGNTNGVNTYQGIDIANFTNGVYDSSSLLQGNNLACFFYQLESQAIPDTLSSQAAALLFKTLDSTFGALACPNVTKFNDNAYTQYPGRHYSPKGKANTC